MYFADEGELLNSLEDDWSVLLKNVKNREEWHLELLQLNRAIISRERREDDQAQLDEELFGMREKLKRGGQVNNKIEEGEKEISERYEGQSVSFEGVSKFLARVGGRVIQVTQHYLQKSRLLDANLYEKHYRMKRSLVSMLNQKEKINLEYLMNVVLDYGKHKMQSELMKMEKLGKALELKEYATLKDIYYPNVKPRIGSVEKIREMMIERKREYSSNKEDRVVVKRNKSSCKMKNKGGLHSLYAIMLLSKHPFCEDYAGSTQEKKIRIFNELMTRNRKNNDEINMFLELTGHCESAGKLPESVIASQAPEEVQYENRSCTEVLSVKKQQKVLTESISFSQYLLTESEGRRKQQEQKKDGEGVRIKMFGTKTRFLLKQNEDFPQIFNKTVTQNQQSLIKCDNIKPQVRNMSKKSKLPEITCGISLETKQVYRVSRLAKTKGSFKEDINNMEDEVMKTNKKKEKVCKDEKLLSQRTKMILKNVDLGIQFSSKRDELAVRRDSIMRERKKTDSGNMENTANCKRTLNKFFDSKVN